MGMKISGCEFMHQPHCFNLDDLFSQVGHGIESGSCSINSNVENNGLFFGRVNSLCFLA